MKTENQRFSDVFMMYGRRVFIVNFFYCDLLRARLSSHYEAWSYKKKKRKIKSKQEKLFLSKQLFWFAFNHFLLFSPLTPCPVVALQSCMEWIPIKIKIYSTPFSSFSSADFEQLKVYCEYPHDLDFRL